MWECTLSRLVAMWKTEMVPEEMLGEEAVPKAGSALLLVQRE